MKQHIPSDIARLLTFRLTREEFSQFNYGYLACGLFCTWVVGMGRWWDDPGAHLLQHLGVGSLVYIFILAAIIRLVVWPLNSQGLTYRHVLTFVSLTSPPAILYAIPVERFLPFAQARKFNVMFLAVVATWRVALLLFYLGRHARLRPLASLTSAFLPVTAIVVTLTVLNLERAAYASMAGLRGEPTANDAAYGLLTLITSLAVLLFIPLFICYVVLAVKAHFAVDDADSPRGTTKLKL